MADIYAGAIFNIAAASAIDGTHGCFGLRDPENIKLSCDVLPASTEAVPWRYFDISQESKKLEPYRIIDGSLVVTPLYKRAWILQELLLAPRVLYFCDGQIAWQCQERRAFKKYAEVMDTMGVDSQILLPKTVPGAPPGIDRVIDWCSIIERYTALQLSFPSKDKLAAIAGVAKRFGPSEYYLVGLWKPFLGGQLLWAVKRDGMKPKKVEKLSALSWTWASIHAEVATPSFSGFQDYLKLLDDQVTYATNDRMGQVTNGYLHIEGSLVGVRLIRSEATVYRFKHWDLNKIPCRHSLKQKVQILCNRPDLNDLTLCGNVVVEWDDFNDNGREKRVFCLLVGTDEWLIRGLLVFPSGRRGFYRRLGTFSVSRVDQTIFYELFRKGETSLDSRPELYHSKVIRPNDGFRPELYRSNPLDRAAEPPQTDLPRFTIWLE